MRKLSGKINFFMPRFYVRENREKKLYFFSLSHSI